MSKGRKPANLGMQGGGNRQRVWEVLRKHRDGLSLYALARTASVDDGTVLSYLRCLIAGGYVSRNGRSYARSTYTVLRDVGAEAPRLSSDGSTSHRGRGVEAMWRTLRLLGEVDALELASLASTPERTVSKRVASNYLCWLSKAGYVQTLRPTQGRHYRYRLLPGGNTGPRPPVLQHIGQLFDPNLGEVVYRQAVEVDE